jgi:hypothetical protein
MEALLDAGRPSKLPPNDMRIELAAYATLALDASKAAVLRGEAVDIGPWRQLVDQLTGLCPKSERLTVSYVYTCWTCKSESQRDPAELCAKCHAELPPKAELFAQAMFAFEQ